MSNDINDKLKEFGDLLQEEADKKIKIAMDLYSKCSGEYRVNVIHKQIGFSGELTAQNLYEHFDTAELIDTIDPCIEDMKKHIESKKLITDSEEKEQIGRLAMRQEGNNWNAYYAENETMEGAVFLGSIRMSAITDNPERQEAFKDIMRGIVGDIFEEKLGTRPEWTGETGAPEHERSGSA